MRSVHRSVLNTILQISPSPEALLDVGSGNGAFTRVLAAYLPQTSVTALDLNARMRFTVSDRIRFVSGSIAEAPFESGSFDVVTATLSLHHWNDKEMALSEISRIMKDGGHLIIGDPLIKGWLENRILGWLVQRLDGGRFMTSEEFIRSAKQAGFTSIEVFDVPQSMKSLFLITAVKK